MVKIVDTNEFKLDIEGPFSKTPVFNFNDQYLGLAWFEGE